MPDDNTDTMQGQTGSSMEDQTDNSDTQQSESDEATSVFLPKSALDGKTVKPGDTVTLKVLDVDPETGDVECKCDDDNEPSEGGMMDDFDKAVPESQ